jgi:hypothetical protein
MNPVRHPLQNAFDRAVNVADTRSENFAHLVRARACVNQLQSAGTGPRGMAVLEVLEEAAAHLQQARFRIESAMEKNALDDARNALTAARLHLGGKAA